MQVERYKDIEAVQISQENAFAVASWSGGSFHILPDGAVEIAIPTHTGRVWVKDAEWVFKDKYGNFWALQDKAFKEAYMSEEDESEEDESEEDESEEDLAGEE